MTHCKEDLNLPLPIQAPLRGERTSPGSHWPAPAWRLVVVEEEVGEGAPRGAPPCLQTSAPQVAGVWVGPREQWKR